MEGGYIVRTDFLGAQLAEGRNDEQLDATPVPYSRFPRSPS